MASGYLYILRNPSYPNLLKIGKTQRDPSVRAQELSYGTGVPESFEVIYQTEVYDCDNAELWTHKHLERYRHNSGKEFFEISAEEAIKTIKEIGALFLERQIEELEETLEARVKDYRLSLLSEIAEKRTHLDSVRTETPESTLIRETHRYIYVSPTEKHYIK
jgi:hypothetical protein